MFFLLASFATLIAPLFAPSLRLFFLFPTLSFFFYKNNLSTSLWMAFITGFLLDLTTSGNRLGLFALNYTLTTALLYQFTPYFFVDRLSTLPIMTFLFSSTAACFQLFLEAIFLGKFHLSFAYVIWDLLLMPACDASFAFAILLFWKAIKTQRSAYT